MRKERDGIWCSVSSRSFRFFLRKGEADYVEKIMDVACFIDRYTVLYFSCRCGYARRLLSRYLFSGKSKGGSVSWGFAGKSSGVFSRFASTTGAQLSAARGRMAICGIWTRFYDSIRRGLSRFAYSICAGVSRRRVGGTGGKNGKKLLCKPFMMVKVDKTPPFCYTANSNDRGGENSCKIQCVRDH